MSNMRFLNHILNFGLVLVSGIFNTMGLAESKWSGQTAAGVYQDESLTAKTFNLGVGSEFILGGEGNNYLSSIQATLNHQKLQKSSDESAKKIDLQGGDHLESKTYGLQLSQSLGVMQSVQALYSAGKVGAHDNHSYGGGYQRWLLADRLRAGFAVKRNHAEQSSKDFADIDGKRVITPDTLEGNNYQFNLLSYVSPTTIGLADYSHTTRTDRPSAWSGSFQIRQYAENANGSLHLGLSHYENVGTIQPITTFGSIVANAAHAEWHQKLHQQYVLMSGYRFYAEQEKLRSADAPLKNIGSDYIYTSLRYRFIKSWTYRSNEVSVSYGHYLHNAGLTGNNLSLGFDWIL